MIQSSYLSQRHHYSQAKIIISYQHRGNNPQNGIPNPDRARQPPSCALCDLVKESDVPKSYVNLDFTDIHDTVMDKQLFPNQCLSWMILSIDERIRVLQKSELYCQVCMRLPSKGAAASGRLCSNGKHIPNTERNGLCTEQSCSYDVTICKQHEQENRVEHHRIKKAIVWKNEKLNDLGHNDQITCIAISSPEEDNEVVNHINSVRKDTYMNPISSQREMLQYNSDGQQINNDEINVI